jgi:hypothetical protein
VVSASVISAVSSGPTVKLRRDLRRRRGGAGEVDAGDPRLRLGERDVAVQDAVGFSVRKDALADRDGEQGAAAACHIAPEPISNRGDAPASERKGC